MDEIDEDGSGELDKKEFKQWFKSLSAAGTSPAPFDLPSAPVFVACVLPCHVGLKHRNLSRIYSWIYYGSIMR